MFKKSHNKSARIQDEENVSVVKENVDVNSSSPKEDIHATIVRLPDVEDGPFSQGMPDVYDFPFGGHGRPGLERFESGKHIDFQVRVVVIQARQLVGANIDPLVRVTVKNQMKQTRVKKSTNNPWWHESFFFNFLVTASDLRDGVVEFTVYNSRTLRSDASLGSYKCDIGMIYNQHDHAYINKWILLSDPDDISAICKGYVKISACVLGPGDVAPNMDLSHNDEDDDIERNLLKAVGVSLRPATFSVYLYLAEDIPTVDSFMDAITNVFHSGDEEMDYPDPYVVMSFAGCEVKSTVMHCSDNPEWYQILKISSQFPSMCERIKIQIRDCGHIGSDKIICTRFASVTALSCLENDGFLPTFGPCFVNIYGAPLENNELQDKFKDMNTGKVEGVAYRGRVLMQLKTSLSELTDRAVDAMIEEDRMYANKFMRKRKYRIYGTFYSATLICSSLVDSPLQFEVSIGYYGNSLDENPHLCLSTTQPMHAAFDGCYYYFLPWTNSKPCVIVDCSWEDISFRLESQNMLLNIEERLTSSLEQLYVGMKAKRPIPQLAQIFISMLNKLIDDCDTPLSPPKAWHAPNELDLMRDKLRKSTLQSVKAEAIVLRDTATNLNEAVNKIEDFVATIKIITIEPQSSMPNIIVWMISNEKRIAYYSFPANELLYSENDEMKGKNCGKIVSVALKYPIVNEKKRKLVLPAVLSLKLWLSLQVESSAWYHLQDGEQIVCAETYENQTKMISTWTSSGTPWSDISGEIPLNKEDFILSRGWQWDGDWYISQETGMLLDKNPSNTSDMVEIYECLSRTVPGECWTLSSKPWTDMKGDPAQEKSSVILPEGWKWDDDWKIDLNRAVDEEGWEYCVDAAVGGYGPIEKPYNLYRRRRWARTRTYIQEIFRRKEIEEGQEKLEVQGWEYAPLFQTKFHVDRRAMDMVRRRRWHRKMISVGNRESFYMSVIRKGTIDDIEQGSEYTTTLVAPINFLYISAAHDYQLRAYIYQARDLIAGDESGLSDPFARVALLNYSMATVMQKETLSPTWNQTLIFDAVKIYRDPDVVEDTPPEIYIELFDYDSFGKPDFLGQTCAQPMVKLDSSDARTPALQWYSIKRLDQDGGELLAAFELIMITEKTLPFLPPKIGDLYCVPTGIRPAMQRTGIEILCWGVRNMKKYQMSSVTSPSIRFECSGHVLNSSLIKDTRKNPNFSENVLFFDVMLPIENLYMPPINIIVRDHRQFGRTPTIGVHVIKSVEEVDPHANFETLESFHHFGLPSVSARSNTMIKSATKEKESDLTQQELDWWAKYYESCNDFDKCRKYHTLGYPTFEVLTGDLENSHNYKGFNDFCSTQPLFRGKQKQNMDDSNIVGELKSSFCKYPLPADPDLPLPPRIFQNLPKGDPEECIVRVYVIRAYDLQPCDPNGLADPYLEIELGKQLLSTKDDYIPNTLHPTFGSLFELKALLPIYKDLIIRVKDYDLLTLDDTVGETTIDLENRYLTRFRATCGLPKTYCVSGVNTWRDSQKPTDILIEYCKTNRHQPPVFVSKTEVTIGNKYYKLSDFESNVPESKLWGQENERLALHILNLTPLVKEHVESRALFNALQPGLEQGRVQMWVDIFPKSLGPPGPPFDITAREPVKFVLSCVIWNTYDVILDDVSFTGQKMSDIYVQGWMEGIDDKLKTDVHYRSLNGEGNFNWRFVYPFDYLMAEQKMVVKKKEHLWSLDKTEFKKPPKLILQIWDNDKFFSDDFLGQLELDLNSMPLPVKRSRSCNLNMLPEVGHHVKLSSLFEMKHAKGFWPCHNDSSGVPKLTGKLEMELQLMPAVDFDKRPSGVGRDEPNVAPKLDAPKRPDTSFLWFMSPWKSLKFVIWLNYKAVIIRGLFFILLVLLILIFVYSFPGNFSFWLMNRL